MTEFKKYTSIDNSYKQKTIDHIVAQGFSKEEFAVVEKVHGANFGIHYDAMTNKVTFSRRSDFLKEGEAFFNYQDIAERLERAMRDLRQLPLSLDGKTRPTNYTIFGELCGGILNGETNGSKKAVFTEVEYAPSIQFLAFDIVIDGKFLPLSMVMGLCKNINLHTCPVLGIYSDLESAMLHKNDANSAVPELLGFESPEVNIMEGTIIRPANKAIKLANGARLILKNKNSKFSEKKQAKVGKPMVELGEVTKLYLQKVESYVTMNRMNSVVSKFGEPTRKDTGKLLGLLVKDVYEALTDDGEALFKTVIPKEELQPYSRNVNELVRKVVLQYLDEQED